MVGWDDVGFGVGGCLGCNVPAGTNAEQGRIGMLVVRRILKRDWGHKRVTRVLAITAIVPEILKNATSLVKN